MGKNVTNKALTPKQQRFVDEYLVDLNATQAAIRAGYSKKTSRFIAAENLSKPNIAAAIASRCNAIQEETQVTQQRVFKELARIGFSDVRQLFDQDGRLKMITDLPGELIPAISSVKVVTRNLPGGPGMGQETQPCGCSHSQKRNAKVEYILEIKFFNKISALGEIARRMGI